MKKLIEYGIDDHPADDPERPLALARRANEVYGAMSPERQANMPLFQKYSPEAR